MRSLILLAAGRGTRAGFKKQFADLCGKPVFMHSLDKVEGLFDEVFLVLPPEDVNRVSVPGWVRKVEGGRERQDSVFNALRLAKGDVVVVHDSARPLATREMFEGVLELGSFEGKVVGARARDTLKEVEGGRVIRTLRRELIWHIQTPQGFLREVLFECHLRARAEGFVGTDDASLLERYGYSVGVFEGSFWNIKITYPEDLALLRRIVCGKS
ncbi:MAG: 2-C-methyl-D-erythritol 4-phosphate cytidylyltransferase [Aquificae bacterium]|nr:2-C-methyl-D-erythritol 4-phosphate cytidylyltransferase [Aquificota bacterium]